MWALGVGWWLLWLFLDLPWPTLPVGTGQHHCCLGRATAAIIAAMFCFFSGVFCFVVGFWILPHIYGAWYICFAS